MVMEALSPQNVGREFVRQYYTLLNKAPLHLHRFYSGDSSFVHGGLDNEEVRGQQEIHQKIMQLNFRDCKAKIRQVDAHATLSSGVVVQVLGELSNNQQPMRRFMQTFVLAPQTPKKYYVYNDIFRYQDEVFSESQASNPVGSGFEADTMVENEKNIHGSGSGGPGNDGIATVSIIDGVQKQEPHLNGGSSTSNNPVTVNELSPRVPVEVPPANVEVSSATVASASASEAAVEEAVDGEEDTDGEAATSTNAGAVSAPAEAEVKPEPSAQQQQQPPVAVTTASEATAPSTNEKPTYANLFKKSSVGGGLMVASGPSSLPPAGFNKSPSTSAAAGTSSQATSSSSMSPPGSSLKDFQQGKPFRGGMGGRGGGRGGLNNAMSASRDRYHPSRESVSSNVGDEPNNPDRERGNRGGGSRMGMNSLSNYPDSHQVFVGNLPHHCQERDLEDLFSKFGKVMEVRINTKGVDQSKMVSSGQKSVPNFGFVVFEDEKTAIDCLSQKPINLPNGHRLNVETKKKNNRDDGKGAFGGSSGGANRGSGSNFDRGSQEQLGGLGRGGLNSNSGRGNSRGRGGGGGRGGFSGGRGGGSGPPSQGGGAGIPGAAGSNSQNRPTYTRRS